MAFALGTAHGNELNASFYNEAYSTTQGEYSLTDFRKSRYYPMYCKALELLVINRARKVLEVGCGVGHFAQLLHRTGKFEYTGFDFSEIAVQKAQNKIPSFNFYCQDVYLTDLFETEDFINSRPTNPSGISTAKPVWYTNTILPLLSTS